MSRKDSDVQQSQGKDGSLFGEQQLYGGAFQHYWQEGLLKIVRKDNLKSKRVVTTCIQSKSNIKGTMGKKNPLCKHSHNSRNINSPGEENDINSMPMNWRQFQRFERLSKQVTTYFSQFDEDSSPLASLQPMPVQEPEYAIQEEEEEKEQQATQNLPKDFSEVTNRYHLAHIEYILSYEHSMCPLTYGVKRSKKQSRSSQFWFQAKCLGVLEAKGKESAQRFAKRKDQEFRNLWDMKKEDEKNESDQTFEAIHYLSSFPEKKENVEILEKLFKHQKKNTGLLELLSAMAEGDDADSFCSVNHHSK